MCHAPSKAKEATSLNIHPWALLTSPSSGQAAISPQLRNPMLLACHSSAALGGQERRRDEPHTRLSPYIIKSLSMQFYSQRLSA
jgi:hypothetical protein